MYGKTRNDFKAVVNKSNNAKIQCPHCGKVANLGNIKRWHFDNCKYKN